MPKFYYVQLTIRRVETSDRRRESSSDLYLEDLEKRFLAPYRKGTAIVIKGRSVAPADLHRIKIYESERMVGNFASIPWSMLTDVTEHFITGPPGWESEERPSEVKEARPPTDTREIFVVRGRNDKARDALFDFLRAIDLRPLELADAVPTVGKTLPYIAELLDAGFRRAHAVVVLFTPDDEAWLREPYRSASDPAHESVLSGQARPNVLFEAGMAMGRGKERTVLVELGTLRPFTDIAGLHVTRLSDSSESRQDLARRLELAGCPVNLEGTDWHKAGDFEAALASMGHRSPETNAEVEQQMNTEETPSLTEEARDLLIEAAQDTAGMIVMIRAFGGVKISTNGKAFGDTGNARSEAKWKQAIKELLNRGLIEDTKGKGEVFEVTHEGFEVAGSLGLHDNPGTTSI